MVAALILFQMTTLKYMDKADYVNTHKGTISDNLSPLKAVGFKNEILDN